MNKKEVRTMHLKPRSNRKVCHIIKDAMYIFHSCAAHHSGYPDKSSGDIKKTKWGKRIYLDEYPVNSKLQKK
jgi:hypothetical protein